MVTTCVAYRCSYRHRRGSETRLFRFPKDKKRRQLWINAMKREGWTPSNSSRVCGKHFQTGKPNLDENHPDYVPNVFSFTTNKNTAEVYEKRKKRIEKRKQLSNCSRRNSSDVESAADTLMFMAQKHQSVDSIEPEVAEDVEMTDETPVYNCLEHQSVDSIEPEVAEDVEMTDETPVYNCLEHQSVDLIEPYVEEDVEMEERKETAVEMLMLLRQGHQSEEVGEPAVETLALVPQGHQSEEVGEPAFETLVLLPEGHQSEEVGEPAFETLVLLPEGHQSEYVRAIEVAEKEVNLEAELEKLKAKLKVNEELNITVSVENVELKERIIRMDLEMRLLREERNILHKTTLALKPTEKILSQLDLLKLYTGLPSRNHFDWLIRLLENDTSAEFLSRETQLLMVLMKIKLNLLLSDIACRFLISNTTMTKIVDLWIPLLSGKLQSCISWPTRRSLKKNCPQTFKHSEYKRTVCIIDCTEIRIEKPSNLIAQSQLWSNYKSHLTVKFFVATTPSGGICFISKAYGGRSSDKDIILKSGFLRKISPGDLILADRGFTVEEHFTAKGARLVVPSFTRGKEQLSKEEVIYSNKVSNVRIHIERVIKMIKRFHVLKGKLNLSFLRHINNVIIISAGLSNLSSSIIP